MMAASARVVFCVGRCGTLGISSVIPKLEPVSSYSNVREMYVESQVESLE
jgi:hypothetical protein